jgi:DNA sulfur modification protein DndC
VEISDMSNAVPTPFDGIGLRATVRELIEEIKELYLSDNTPWVVGYSGGKDSTAVLQLVWFALREVPAADRTKPVHVISTDTLVENPVVASWVTHSLDCMQAAASGESLPITPHRLTPVVKDTFWVSLIGKGYPAPRPRFRWCTERLKINPSNAFITDIVRSSGEAILVLGIRKAESSARSRAMTRHERLRARERLSPNASLSGSQIYSPIEAWSNDEVWMFLMQDQNPWGYNNRDLLTMYQGASPDGECPLVIDTSTPSCGDSRFGCWVCTLVEKDRSMQAMIQNDSEKAWMLPLLSLRDALDVADDRHLRDFRRMNGNVQLFHDRPIPGPYTQTSRETWLRRLLETQRWLRENAPPHIHDLRLVSVPELEEIRRLWVVEKHELEDSLPEIYETAMGESYPGQPLDDGHPFGALEMKLLREVSSSDLEFQMLRELIDTELQYRTTVRRSGLFDVIEKVIRKHYYHDEEDAVTFARWRATSLHQDDVAAERNLPILDGPESTSAVIS